MSLRGNRFHNTQFEHFMLIIPPLRPQLHAEREGDVKGQQTFHLLTLRCRKRFFPRFFFFSGASGGAEEDSSVGGAFGVSSGRCAIFISLFFLEFTLFFISSRTFSF